jgi:hypothetical protein
LAIQTQHYVSVSYLLLPNDLSKPTSNPRDGILRRQSAQRQLQSTNVDIGLCSTAQRRQRIIQLLIPWWDVGAQVYGRGRDMG